MENLGWEMGRVEEKRCKRSGARPLDVRNQGSEEVGLAIYRAKFQIEDLKAALLW